MPSRLLLNSTEAIEEIDGHQYRVRRDASGNILYQSSADPEPPVIVVNREPATVEDLQNAISTITDTVQSTVRERIL